MTVMDTRMVLLSILIIWFLPTPSLAQSVVRCHKDDYTALMKIKAAFHNSPEFATWIPNTDCCSHWYFVNCDPKTNRIFDFDFFQNNISGEIPPELGDLPYLETISFTRIPGLTGTIPSTISKLKYLSSIIFSSNKLSGPIPSFLGELSNLTHLELSSNQFTGTIPKSFGNFMGDLVLSDNKLEGDASIVFNANPSIKMKMISLSTNMFAFDLSKVKFFPSNLQYLDISHNNIFGSIPESITQLDLEVLDVSYNQLSGEIPQGGKVQSFDSSNFDHNNGLCGPPLPAVCGRA